MAFFDKHSVPGYTAAVAREQRIRDGAFLGLNEWIADIEVKPFTPLHFTRLEAVRSPFTTGERDPADGDLAVFLWIVSPHWRPRRTLLDRLAHWWFLKRLKLTDRTEDAINQYIDDAFFDSPKGTGGAPSESYSSFAASIIQQFPGWNADTTLNTPFKILFQLLNERHFEKGMEAWSEGRRLSRPTRSNPSEEIQRRYFQELNFGTPN